MNNKIYIFKYINACTGNYHPGGGLIVVSKNIEQAKKLMSDTDYVEATEDEWIEAIEGTTDLPPMLITFPDTGCC